MKRWRWRHGEGSMNKNRQRPGGRQTVKAIPSCRWDVSFCQLQWISWKPRVVEWEAVWSHCTIHCQCAGLSTEHRRVVKVHLVLYGQSKNCMSGFWLTVCPRRIWCDGLSIFKKWLLAGHMQEPSGYNPTWIHPSALTTKRRRYFQIFISHLHSCRFTKESTDVDVSDGLWDDQQVTVTCCSAPAEAGKKKSRVTKHECGRVKKKWALQMFFEDVNVL